MIRRAPHLGRIAGTVGLFGIAGVIGCVGTYSVFDTCAIVFGLTDFLLCLWKRA